ncbi:MAG: hypothetical protein ACFFFG_07475 [Candidatus Thorarchaeota archaeon]
MGLDDHSPWILELTIAVVDPKPPSVSSVTYIATFDRNINSFLITFIVGIVLLVFGLLLRLSLPDPLASDSIFLHIGMILGAIILSGLLGGFVIGKWRQGFKPTFWGGLFATFVFFHATLFLVSVSYSGSPLAALFIFEFMIFTFSVFSGPFFGLFGILGGLLAQILR